MNENKKRHQNFKKWVPLIGVALVMAVLFYLGFYNLDYLDILVQNKDKLKNIASENYKTSLLIFCILYIFSVALSIPIATILTLLGGYLYGLFIGTLAVTFSATIGASLIFLIAKSSFGSFLRDKANQAYISAREEINNNAFHYLLFLRLIPLFPFFLVNILPALFNISLRLFILTTFIGIIPGTIVYINFGHNLGKVNDFNDILSIEMIFSFILLGCFVLLPVIYKHMKVIHDAKK